MGLPGDQKNLSHLANVPLKRNSLSGKRVQWTGKNCPGSHSVYLNNLIKMLDGMGGNAVALAVACILRKKRCMFLLVTYFGDGFT